MTAFSFCNCLQQIRLEGKICLPCVLVILQKFSGVEKKFGRNSTILIWICRSILLMNCHLGYELLEMNTEILNEHLETLAGHVFDNDKLVTYKWLSKELHVHVNIAKQILWNFHQKYRNGNNIECTYLLIGHLKEKGMHVEVVRDSDVSKAKEKFSKIISEHVYSVHKPIMDLQLLATTDSGDVKYSAIKFDAKIRSDEEMQLLRWGTATKKVIMENVSDFKSTDSTNLFMTEKNITKKISPQRDNSVKKGSLDHFFGKVTFPSKSVEVTSSEKKYNNAKKEFIEEKVIRENKNLLEKKWNRSKETDEIAKKRKITITQNDSSDLEIQNGMEMQESFPKIELEILAKPKSFVSENEKEKEETRRKGKKAAETKKVKKKQSTLTNFFKKC